MYLLDTNVVTRNVRDFKRLGMEPLDPFIPAP